MWLPIQMGVELLIVAIFGGVAGWFAHELFRKQMAVRAITNQAEGSEASAQARIADLEAELADEKAEHDDLRRKSGIPRTGEEGVLVEGSLAWRNRHLESRVRFLEGKLADLETEGEHVRPTEDQNDEATRLRWRNRYLDGRVKYLEEELVRTGGLTPASEAPIPSAASAPPSAHAKPPEGDKPLLLETPRGGKGDDLKLISGIGPKLEQKLNSMGIWHYDQVAAWTQKEIDWVNAAISFRGRIERENWGPQARALLEGAMPQAAESNTG
jgi:predicted flap endonuclease-1-like 5' DNA nuclease